MSPPALDPQRHRRRPPRLRGRSGGVLEITLILTFFAGLAIVGTLAGLDNEAGAVRATTNPGGGNIGRNAHPDPAADDHPAD